jgi:dihydrofolate reductase
MLISLVVAAATNNVIGNKGQLPWRLPNDMKFFKNITWGMPVIMGRKTFESLGKPLVGRKNIVISRNETVKNDGIVVVKNIEDALFVASQTDAREVMIIGGGEIYRNLFPRAGRIYITRVDAEPEGDTFFPVIDGKEWHLMSQKNHEADEKNAFNYSFQIWERYHI